MNRIKIIVLSLLVVLSTILTAYVWFDGITSNWSLGNQTKDSYKELIDGEITFVTPTKLTLFNQSQKEFYLIKRTRAEFNELNFSIRKLMQQVLLTGDVTNSENINWKEVWNQNAINLELGLKIRVIDWMEDLHVVRKKNGHKEFEFDNVIINLKDNQCITYLVNEEDDQVLRIITEDDLAMQIAKTLSVRTLELAKSETLEKVESTKYSNITEFRNNIYFQKEKAGVVYNPVFNIKVPFIDTMGITDLQRVEEFINPFFTSSASKYLVEDNTQKNLTYRDERVIVKYNTEAGIIEYSDISVGKGVTPNISNAFKSAIAFMEKDSLLQNVEIHLSDYNIVENEAYFYFEYTFDDYDIVIPGTTKDAFGVNAPIEVVVSNGKVSFYKRWIFEYEISMGTFESVNQDYQYVIDELKEYGESKQISDAYLAYVYDDGEKECEITWIADTNNKRFLIPVK